MGLEAGIKRPSRQDWKTQSEVMFPFPAEPLPGYTEAYGSGFGVRGSVIGAIRDN